MNGKQRLEVSKMLKLLKKEENYYEKTLQNVKQELMRLQIEGLSLNASVRQEEMRRQQLNVEENSSPAPVKAAENSVSFHESISLEKKEEPPSELFKIPLPEQDILISSLQENDNSCDSASLKSSSVAGSVMSSINDDRYLEPLFLNPNYFGHDAFVDFDD